MMNVFQNKVERIKNYKTSKPSKDFHYSALSFLILGIFIGGGFAFQINFMPEAEIDSIVKIASGLLLGGVIIAAAPMWITVIFSIILLWILQLTFLDLGYYPITLAGSVGFIISACFQLIFQWDKIVILRMGKFKRVHGPGLHVILPLVDRIAAFIDTRIRATDFSAEKTLTRDTVPVHVDALAFWMIWDAKQAVLEVEDYLEAVTLSAQTALRTPSDGMIWLRYYLKGKSWDRKYKKALDTKTNPWGVSILSIEITDIIIPRELEDAMSKQAQAERERQSRVILGTAEVEIAEKFEKAAEKYKDNPVALQLRAMNMVFEGIRQNKSSLMLMPSSALDNMNLGAALGTAALNKVNEKEVVKKLFGGRKR